MEGHLPGLIQFHLQQVNLSDTVQLNTLVNRSLNLKTQTLPLTNIVIDVIAVKSSGLGTIGAMENLAQKICKPQEIQKAMGHTLRQLRQGI